MEDWTEADLFKLSVKELKSLARRGNVNTKAKKADLVKALLTNVKDIADHCEDGGAQTSTSRRITRSRVSIWQSSDETLGHAKEIKAKFKDEEGNLNLRIKDSVDDKRAKKKIVRAADNIDACDTSEMFPLVSIIQLASKSLVEITNKDISRHKQDKKIEIQAAVATSKKSKQNKVQNKNIEDDLLTNNTGGKGVCSDVNPCLTAETNERKDFDLNDTFIVEKKINASQDVNRKSTKRKQKQVGKGQSNEEQNLHPSNQLHEQIIIKKSNKSELSSENQQDLNFLSVNEDKSSSEKPKRGIKRKSESLVVENTAIHCESVETSDLVGNLNGPSKRRKKDIEEKEFKLITKIILDIKNSPVEDLYKITDKSSETSDSKLAQIKKLTASNMTQLGDSKKRNMRNSPLPENSNNSESSLPKTDQNKSKSKKGAQAFKTNCLGNTENIKDEKVKRGKNNNQDLSLEDESSKAQELTALFETSLKNSSSFQRSSRRSGTLPSFKNESTVVNGNNLDTVMKGVTQERHNSNEDILEAKDISAVHGETGPNSIQAPIRSSTFILSDSGDTGETEKMPEAVPKRNATFILTDTDGKSPQRRSLRFSPGPALETKATLSRNADTYGKSIGRRIVQTSIKRGDEKSLKKEPGSALKKTLMKNTKSGSIVKKRPATKLPDFKKIHQQLFNNMESLSEHKKRQQDRGLRLLQSPIVPRCAVFSPRPSTARDVESSPHRKAENTKVKTPVAPSPRVVKVKPSVAPSPLATKVKTPVAPSPLAAKVKTPVAPSPLAARLKTPVAYCSPMVARKPVPVASSVNRFGFRKPVKKEEATSIIGKKLPSFNLEKKKEEDRNVLKGVRMNKRFMLQMQMRQKRGQ